MYIYLIFLTGEPPVVIPGNLAYVLDLQMFRV